MLPVQQFLNKPRLDLESNKWLCPLWKARVHVNERHLKQGKTCKQWLENYEALLPVGSLVVIKLNLLDKEEYSSKLGPIHLGFWVVVERLTNRKTYQVKDIVFGNERQVTREQKKVFDIPTAHESAKERWLRVLPQFNRVHLGETVLAPQKEGGEKGKANHCRKIFTYALKIWNRWI